MKILMISHEYPPIGGGGANACMFLASEYAKQGHNVIILTVWYEGEKEFDRIISANDCGNDKNKAGTIDIYRVKSKRKYREHCSFVEMFDYLVKAFPLARKLGKNENIDICQVFFGIPSGPIGLYLKKKYKIPYVIRFGGGDIPGFQKRFGSVYKVLAPFIRCIWNNADSLVANSKGLKRLALDFSPDSNIRVIHNGVDLLDFTPRDSFAHNDNTVRMLFVSRLIERKGLQYLIPRLDELEEKILPMKLMLTIVGDGPYRQTLEQLAKTVNTEVVFVGQKSKSELCEYYQNADVFVFPSCKEGMPNVVLEAMACGLPIVMNSCEGSEELIQTIKNPLTTNDQIKDVNGLISEGQEQFVNTVGTFLLLPELIKEQMSGNSRKRVCELFSWINISNEYTTLFAELLKNKNKVSEDKNEEGYC